MARVLQLTVELHADPELPDEIAQNLADEIVVAVNEIGYVSEIRWLADRTGG